jgi:sec-independent protein translocase protein TatA
MSGGELFVIFFVVLLLFGSKKIPELARGIGKGMREIKKATDDIKNEINKTEVGKEINDARNELNNAPLIKDIKKEINDINKNLIG